MTEKSFFPARLSFLLIFLFSMNYLTAQDEEGVQQLSEQILKAVGFAEVGKYDEALAVYDELIEQYPAPMLYVLKGEVYTKFSHRMTSDEKAYFNSLRLYNKAISIDSTFIEAYTARGKLNIFHQKYPEAVQDFTKVIELATDNEMLFYGYSDRGSAKSYTKDYAGALKDYNKALKLRPNQVTLLSNMGMLYLNLGQIDDAQKVFDKALSMDSTEISVLINYGFMLIQKEQYQSAEALFSKAVDVSPKDPLAYNNLGYVNLKLNRPSKALELINKSLAIYPENSYAYKNRALVYLENKEIEKACADLNKAEGLGYSISYDDEVKKLLKQHCH
ncbi:MAG: tetratricopeptide repeat protein [Bacteroidota bacterium]